jgi:hypothetical protein
MSILPVCIPDGKKTRLELAGFKPLSLSGAPELGRA